MKFLSLTCSVLLLVVQSAWAFPPAPSSTIYGKVRGEFGYGPEDGRTDLLLLADGVEKARAKITDSEVFGENYRLVLPLDLNATNGKYRSEALTPGAGVVYSFVAERNGVRIPISRVEAIATSASPEAASIQRLNLVMGVDSDGDGLPDSWERYQAGVLGDYEGDPLDLFSATGDRDGDGLSDQTEYIAGTFALLFEDGFNFHVSKVFSDYSTELKFFSVEDKSYRIYASTDLKRWTPVEFSTPADPLNTSSILKAARSIDQTVYVDPQPEGQKVFYRLLVD